MKKIIIADDSVFQRKVLSDLVKELGFEPTVVHTGEDLLNSMDLTYSCIFLDLLMPGMSGIDVLEELQKRQNTIPVVVITADIQESKKKRCMELGAAAFINKVIKPKEIENTLNKILN